jgi:hypothetical protein
MSSTSLYPTSRLWRGTWLRQSCLDVFMSAAFFVIGFSPITALAVAILGLLPLPITTLTIVLPATVLGIFLALRFTAYGKLALQGLILGLIAVFLYDCMRVPFILTGVWGDFIPKINMWLFNTSHPNWMVGYVWRYLGDGGFMGMAFTVGFYVLKPRVSSRVAGLGFGLAIWICLVLTLILAPHGQEMLFQLTVTTVSLSLLGHIIYGLALGIFFPYVCRESTIEAGPEGASLDLEPKVKETLFEEETTIKLPPIRWQARPLYQPQETHSIP